MPEGRVAIYTALYGDYDVLHEQTPQDVDVEWVCFTDAPELRSPSWRVVLDAPRSDQARLSAKFHKMHPAEVLPDFRHAIWVDANVVVDNPAFAREALDAARRSPSGVTTFRHPQRDCIVAEAEVCADLPGFADAPVVAQARAYVAEGYPMHGGLFGCRSIVWDTADGPAAELGRRWFAECERWTLRDQISFPVVAHRLGVRPGVFAHHLYRHDLREAAACWLGRRAGIKRALRALRSPSPSGAVGQRPAPVASTTGPDRQPLVRRLAPPAAGMSRRPLSRDVQALLRLLTTAQRRRLGLLATLAAGNAVLEAVGTGFVLALVTAATGSSDISDPIGSIIHRAVGTDATSRTVLVVTAVTTLGFYLVKNSSGLLEHYLQQRLVHQTAAEGSTALVARYMGAPLSMHDEQHSGDMIQQSWVATEQVYRNSLLAVTSLVSELLAASAILLVLLIAAPVATAGIVAVMVLLVGVIYGSLRGRITAWGRDLQELSSASLQVAGESFGAVRDARLYGKEDEFVRRYRTVRAELAKAFWRSGTATNAPRYLLETSFVIGMVVAVLLVSKGGTTTGNLSVLGLYAYAGLRMMPSLNRVVFSLGTLRLNAAFVTSVTDVLGMPVEPVPTSDAEPFHLHHDLAASDVSYTYPSSSQKAIRSVDLQIRLGESVGIVGPSGAGKSTLVDLLVGLLTPDEGSVRVDGRDIEENLPSWRRRIGYVSQFPFMLDDTVRANVAFGVAADEADDDAVWQALEEARIADFIRSSGAGLDGRLGERGVRLSGGQRQRIAIARALYRQPDVLVLDEATSALDTRTEEEVAEALQSGSEGRTTVIVAHRLSTVRRCDRIVFLVDGAAAAFGPFDELERLPAFRRFISSGELSS